MEEALKDTVKQQEALKRDSEILKAKIAVKKLMKKVNIELSKHDKALKEKEAVSYIFLNYNPMAIYIHSFA
jgi:hypothetical protein